MYFMNITNVILKIETNKLHTATERSYQGPFANSFFEPFGSLTVSPWQDAKSNLKACFARPITDLSGSLFNAVVALSCLISSIQDAFFGLIFLDFEQLNSSAKFLDKAINNTIASAYLAISALSDCLDAVARLITHSLATLASCIYPPKGLPLVSEKIAPISYYNC